MMGYYYDSMHGYGGVLAIIFWILLIVGLVLLIIWGVRSTETRNKNNETALDILKKRYAKGDISKEEYEQLKRDIMS
ncbi:SHOCT domain-containing protein [Candidatus Poribacteria bacterium]|nr:SHOCT domain-containing protein [Candidatus Poribacteria bacterium]